MRPRCGLGRSLFAPFRYGFRGQFRMSALGKVYGDFDSNGQLVDSKATPAERVLERSVIVTRTVTEAPVVPPAAEVHAPQETPEIRRPPMSGPLAVRPVPADLVLDRSRDALLTAFGLATLRDRYLLDGESFQDMFARVSCAYADDVAHAQRNLNADQPLGAATQLASLVVTFFLESVCPS